MKMHLTKLVIKLTLFLSLIKRSAEKEQNISETEPAVQSKCFEKYHKNILRINHTYFTPSHRLHKMFNRTP